MKDIQEIKDYYNHFNENKRLLSRHGQVEYLTTLKYIEKYIQKYIEQDINEMDHSYSNENDCGHFCNDVHEVKFSKSLMIADIGAGTGRYSYALAKQGHDLTAVELVEHNLEVLRSQKDRVKIKSYQGNALDLSMLKDNTYDITLLFGPMYHLFTIEDKVQALSEAIRITKPNGYIFVAYVMNEYSVVRYAFKENNIRQCMESGMLSEDYHTLTTPKDLYSYMRLEDIDRVVAKVNAVDTKVLRDKIIAADGAANYIRPSLKAMDDEEFDWFMQYHFATCERMDLMGASAHTVDILKKGADETALLDFSFDRKFL